MHRPAHKLAPLCASLLLLCACGDQALLAVPRGPADAGVAPVADLNGRLIEDFDNQRLVHSVTGSAHLDVNQGVLTLPVERFPTIDGADLGMFRGVVERNGLVESENIVVMQAATLEASDAVEMRARDVVEVAGSIRAGRGGVTLVGGRGVYIDGDIESRGPVRILVEDPAGEVRISGRIVVHASADDAGDLPPHVEILGRSGVEISGRITSTAGARREGGDIRVHVYGAVKVIGPEARVLALSGPEGLPGRIQLRTESDVAISDGAVVGHAEVDTDELILGGDVEVQGATVRIERQARLLAGDGMLKGGSVFITSSRALAIDSGSEVRSGAGPEGGNLIIQAQRIGVGESALVQAGQGRSYGALFEINAVDRLDVVDGAQIRGGSTACGPGGALQIVVGGTVRVRAGAQLQGGDGAVEFGNRMCSETAQGGDVRVQAWQGDGVEEASVGGRGFPNGEVLLDWDPAVTVPPPNLTVGTYGQVLSKIIDRGEAARYQRPVLVGMDAEMPEGTSVTIELCAGDDVQDNFSDCAMADDDAALQAFVGRRYLRYRVRLKGRSFNAPSLDYFELDLSPED